MKETGAIKPYYRAVYLAKRTVKHLIDGISDKFGVDSERVTRVTHINSKGLQIIVDDDVVREVPEGQDMIVEFSGIKGETQTKPDPDSTLLAVAADDEQLLPDSLALDPLEMWLNY